jgi:hypothetical protein
MLKLFETVKKISKVIKAIKVLSVQCKMGKTANLPNLSKKIKTQHRKLKRRATRTFSYFRC